MGPFVQELARQRQQDLQSAAERYRLARIIRDSKTRRRRPSATHAESKPIPNAALSSRPA